jgi:hypothetical protein
LGLPVVAEAALGSESGAEDEDEGELPAMRDFMKEADSEAGFFDALEEDALKEAGGREEEAPKERPADAFEGSVEEVPLLEKENEAAGLNPAVEVDGANENPPLAAEGDEDDDDGPKLEVGKGVEDAAPPTASLAPPNENPPEDEAEFDVEEGKTGVLVGAGAGTAALRTGAEGILKISGLLSFDVDTSCALVCFSAFSFAFSSSAPRLPSSFRFST